MAWLKRRGMGFSNELREGRPHYTDGWHPLVLQSDLAAAIARAEAAERDAARYRWLRDRADKLAVYSDVPVDVLINGAWKDQPGELDAAIDNAIAAQQAEGEA